MSEFEWGKSIPDPEIDRSGEFFADMADHLYSQLTVEARLSEDKAHAVVDSVIVHLSQTFAGEKFYVSRRPAMFAKWLQAYNDLRHMHYLDVDRKYGWSDGYSLRVQQKIREMRQHRNQLRLPL